jgi:P27 family predicted phage terminase small subunit
MLQRGRKSRAALAVEPFAPAPSPDFTPPDPPSHLGKPEQKIWRDIHADFDLSTKAAAHVLVSALEAHQRARVCREAIESEGMTSVGRDGQIRTHPLLPVERDARHAWLAGLKALGLEI